MPRDGSGNYSLPAGTAAVSGALANSSHVNSRFSDLETDANAARPIPAGGTGSTSASAARTALGLEIGTNVQAYDAGLASIAGLTTAADRMIYTTASDTYAVATLTSFARTLLDDADAATARTTLGLGSAAVAGLLDEDDFASNSATDAASQQSTAAYIASRSGTVGASSLSGTSQSLTGVPADATVVELLLNNVNGTTGNIWIRGTVGGVIDGTYATGGVRGGGGTTAVGEGSTNAIEIVRQGSLYGLIRLVKNPSGNAWFAHGTIRNGGGGSTYGGTLAMTGVLDGLNIAATSGGTLSGAAALRWYIQ